MCAPHAELCLCIFCIAAKTSSLFGPVRALLLEALSLCRGERACKTCKVVILAALQHGRQTRKGEPPSLTLRLSTSASGDEPGRAVPSMEAATFLGLA